MAHGATPRAALAASLLLGGLLLFLLLHVVSSQQQKRRCDVPTVVRTKVPCRSCSASERVRCPRGYKAEPRKEWARDCIYRTWIPSHNSRRAASVPMQGCRFTCKKTILDPNCCSGFWGPDCLECPGGAENTCSRHGACLDGIQGNGTCECQHGFLGTACEDCANPLAFGPNCTAVCNCVHGDCDHGVNGTGACSCYTGYEGPRCDQPMSECRALGCPATARCERAPSGKLACRCLPAYRGDGTTCRAVNLCEEGPPRCDPHARCEFTGPGRFACHCSAGFRGDGRVCVPIDPCADRYGGCFENSTTCVYDGPGKSHCECRPGYDGRRGAPACTLVDACATGLACSPHATCVTVAALQAECSCKEGFVGDGTTCYGPIMHRSKEVNELAGSRWQGRLTSSLLLFGTAFSWVLNLPGPYTVFLPVDSAYKNTNVSALLAERPRALHVCRAHTVPGQLMASDLASLRTIYSLSGSHITLVPKEPLSPRLLVPGSSRKIRILQSDITAANGVVHIVESVLAAPGPAVRGDRQLFLSEIIASNAMFSHFRSLLENSELPGLLDVQGAFTVFVPTNTAIDRMRDGRLTYLFTREGRPKLKELVRHHIVQGSEIEAGVLVFTPRVRTVANQVVTVNVSKQGQILLGQDAAPLIEADVLARNGRLHVLDGMLVPPSILPILPHRCDQTSHSVTVNRCVSCLSVQEQTCPKDSVALDSFQRGCIYMEAVMGVPLAHVGCARYCNHSVTKPACCKGFFGPDCKPCPGGFTTPCYNHGKCMDGLTGYGTCSCDEGFEGSACHVCKGPDRHGPNCNLECPCLHGECDNRPGSDGVCREGTCQSGYTGTLCDRRTQRCGSAQYCHAHAACVQRDDGVHSCVCQEGFTGDGASCAAQDPCAEPARGGCHPNAVCRRGGAAGRECVCAAGWSGDGVQCMPRDLCTEPDRAGCSINASCASLGPGQAECTCLPGFNGDGTQCEEIDPCGLNNGECHVQASCEHTGPGRRVCTCRTGYTGDGSSCLGDLVTTLASAFMLSQFNSWVEMASLGEIPSINLTVLVPMTAVIANVTWSGRNEAATAVKMHVLPGLFTLQELESRGTTRLPTLQTGTTLLLGRARTNLTIGDATVLIADVMASNGIIHVIDKMVQPARSIQNLPDLHTRLGQMSQYSTFQELLTEYELIGRIERADAYTVFAPSQAAMDLFRKDRPTHPNDDQVMYHVILGEKLMARDLRPGMHRPTMLGSSYQLGFLSRDDGQLLVNGVPVDHADVETDRGVLHGVTRVLPVLRNRCDSNKTTVTQSKCTSCQFKVDCPPGTVAVELTGSRRKSNCIYLRYFLGRRQMFLGCRSQCVLSVITNDCCEGFFGAQCAACPGQVEGGGACGGHGACSDGRNGTGVCACEEGYTGRACQQCEPGKYGPRCSQDCACVNGRCDDGEEGHGSCACAVGWRGINCDERIKDDLCNKTCHSSANCVSGAAGAAPSCVCAAGFTGNGSNCTAVNACGTDNGGCSVFAACARTKPGQRSCTCLAGYTGDGVVCEEIDPCLENNGGCDVNAECTRIGPNKSVCNCLRGFDGDGKSSCEPINPCRVGNGGCSVYGKCNHTGPGTSTCACNPSYVGDGYTCRGTVFQELSSLPDATGFFFRLQMSKMAELAGPGPFTAFVPSNAAFKKDKKLLEEVVSRGQLGQLLQHHVVACNQLMLSELLAMPMLVSLHGELLPIARVPQEGDAPSPVLLGGVARITTGDHVASNGVVHIVDRLLVPKRMQAFTRTARGLSSVLKNITAVAEDHGYSVFVSLLEKCGLLSLVGDPLHRPYTMLWPTDAALRALPAQRQRFLYAPEHRAQLTELLKFHMVRDSKVLASDMPTVGSLVTMQGSEIYFTCSTANATGDLFVNDGSARVVQRGLEFDGGLVHGLDALLQPPSLGGRCDVFTTIDMKGDCGSCSRLPPCPGSTKTKDVLVRCPFRSVFGVVSEGCRRDCALSVWRQQCCPGFYGRDCQPCPGGAAAPCSQHGVCEDGSARSGVCRCHSGFNGTACEECTPGRYGPSCKPCVCSATGTCDEGVAGAGSCFCAEGWTGQRCDAKLARKPVCVPVCHKNAICRDNGTCRCKPFYEGDGFSCKLVSLCKQANGGCHKWAGCYQKATKVSCRCRTGYKGDGRVCSWEDRCADGNNGGCSENAACTMTGPNKRKCSCSSGFVGNGEQCLPVAVPPVDRCMVGNGGCHPNAGCTDLHHAGGVAGVSHVRAPEGQYRMNRTQAEEACAEQGATIATFSQLSAAQQGGLHICAVGWLAGGHSGYPTVYPNSRCGLGHVGIVDYGKRLNQSELWDVFCFRVKEVQCACLDGFVGDGFSCNGDVLQVLATMPGHSAYYEALLAFANASESGRELMAALAGGDDNITLFLPADTGFGVNETLSWRDVLQHVLASSPGRVPYAELTEGLSLPSRGRDATLAIHTANHTTHKMVNDRIIVTWDEVATNGIIHIIEGPLRAPLLPPEVSGVSGGAVAGVLAAPLLLLALGAAALRYMRRHPDLARFQYSKHNDREVLTSSMEGEEEEAAEVATSTSAVVTSPARATRCKARPSAPLPPASSTSSSSSSYMRFPSPDHGEPFAGSGERQLVGTAEDDGL